MAWGAGAGYLGGTAALSQPRRVRGTTGQVAGAHGRPAGQKWGKTSGRGGYGASRRPTFGQYSTLVPQQKQILSRLMQQTRGQQQYQPVQVGGVDVPGVSMPTAPRPTYGAVGLAGAGQRAGTLGRMMAVSPEEERAAIQRMSAPAMRQFREEILPSIRGGAAATGTTWSTMRAGAEAKAGAGLAESLAGMGEQYRMARRGQAMQAAGLSAQEALGGAGLGMQRYGMEMQPYMQAQQMAGAGALQTQQLGVQAGLERQRMGLQAGLQAQQLGAQQQLGQQGLAAQLLNIPMMGVYTYPGQGQRRVTMTKKGGRPIV